MMTWLSPNEIPEPLRSRAAKVRLVGLDVDGTLTDGKLWFSSDGQELKGFNALDGLGLKLLREHQIEVALISARDSPMVARRARELGLRHVHGDVHDKLATVEQICHGLSIGLDEVAFMGDDLPDLPVMDRVGLPAAPANAHPVVHACAVFRATRPGGSGAVRELSDLVLAAHGLLEGIVQRFRPR